MRKAGYIDSPCGYIRGDEQMQGLAFEAPHHIVALGLRKVSVEGVGIVAVPLQGFGNLLCFLPCLAEHDSVNVGVEVGYAFEGFVTVFLPDHVIEMFHIFRSGVSRPHCHYFRLLHVIPRDGLYFFRKSRGEQ